MSAVAAIAVVSPANEPLFVRCFGEDEEQRRLTSLVHASLDAVEARLAQQAQTEAYLGALCPADELTAFCFVPCTRVRFLFLLPSVRLCPVRVLLRFRNT